LVALIGLVAAVGGLLLSVGAIAGPETKDVDLHRQALATRS
jgi:hypothetical protein